MALSGLPTRDQLVVGTTILICAEITFVLIAVLGFKHNVSLWISIALLLLIIVGFFAYLISLALEPLSRDSVVRILVSLHILSGVGSILTLFANCYRWLGLVPYKENRFFDCLYFSIITWTTVGYGDITPHGLIKIFAAVEALVGYMIMGLLVGVIVSMVQRR